jgi:enamine deaminase RidA (YjgF/YER057c/UK114 family)
MGVGVTGRQTTTISREQADGVTSVSLEHGGIRELFITAVPDRGMGLESMFEKVMRVVREAGATVLRQDVFGTPAGLGAIPGSIRKVCGEVDWPVSWIEEGCSQGEMLTGTHLEAVAGAPVRRILLDGAVAGSVFDNADGVYCRLAGICAGDVRKPRVAQAREVFERMEKALNQAGMAFTDVARTWFYVDRILEWYPDFNAARSGFFEERGVSGRMLPASTGVGGGNPAGSALVGDALAVVPRGGSSALRICGVSSPLQCPAMSYRSSFSRAVEMDNGDCRRLYVSGTASIDSQGNTVHNGDVLGQIDLTLDAVAALLKSRGMGWGDVIRAIAYVKDGSNAALYRRRAAERGMAGIPQVVTENDICRPDLLFEIEVDAVAAAAPPRRERNAGNES